MHLFVCMKILFSMFVNNNKVAKPFIIYKLQVYLRDYYFDCHKETRLKMTF